MIPLLGWHSQAICGRNNLGTTLGLFPRLSKSVLSLKVSSWPNHLLPMATWTIPLPVFWLCYSFWTLCCTIHCPCSHAFSRMFVYWSVDLSVGLSVYQCIYKLTKAWEQGLQPRRFLVLFLGHLTIQFFFLSQWYIVSNKKKNCVVVRLSLILRQSSQPGNEAGKI